MHMTNIPASILFFLSLNLSAQPVITSINVTPPCEDTPPIVFWRQWQNQYGTTIIDVAGSQTSDFCRDVTIEFTTQSNKLYSVELSGDLQVWRKVSATEQLFIQGDGSHKEIRLGCPWGMCFWRVQEQ